jgi:hypothetical protein
MRDHSSTIGDGERPCESRRHWVCLFCAIVSFAVIACLPAPVREQVDRAGLNGTVKDPSDLVLPGVRVVAVKSDSGLHRETVCSGDGSYDIPELPAGVYTVTFTPDGFQELSYTNLIQAAGHTRTLTPR